MNNIDNIEIIIKMVGDASKIALNSLATFEEIVKAEVGNTKAIADLEYICDMVRQEIYVQKENVKITSAKINDMWLNKTMEERRWLTIAKGIEYVLKQLIYRSCK